MNEPLDSLSSTPELPSIMEKNRTVQRLLLGLLFACLGVVVSYSVAAIRFQSGMEDLFADFEHSHLPGFVALPALLVAYFLGVRAVLVVSGLAGIVGAIFGAVFGPNLMRGLMGIRASEVKKAAGWFRDAIVHEETEPSEPSWKPVGVAFHGQHLAIGGVNVWGIKWGEPAPETHVFANPNLPEETHEFQQYTAQLTKRDLTFAAAEVSPKVWAFYQLKN